MGEKCYHSGSVLSMYRGGLTMWCGQSVPTSGRVYPWRIALLVVHHDLCTSLGRHPCAYFANLPTRYTLGQLDWFGECSCLHFAPQRRCTERQWGWMLWALGALYQLRFTNEGAVWQCVKCRLMDRCLLRRNAGCNRRLRWGGFV